MEPPPNNIYCNCCGRSTDHLAYPALPALNNNYNTPQPMQVNIVICKGCKTPSLQQSTIVDEHGKKATYVSYSPPRLWFIMPSWVKDLIELDNNLYLLLQEVYAAGHDNQFRLLAMGVRSALDHVMLKIVGDIGGFEQKLEAMVAQKYLSERQQKMLATVIEAGSAAAHRGYMPSQPLLAQMVSIMEAIIREHYISDPMLKTLRENIPDPQGFRAQKKSRNLCWLYYLKK